MSDLVSAIARDLIGGFLVDKRAFKFALPVRVRRKRMAGLRFAHGLDAQKFRRDIAHGFFRLLLCLVPARAAERVERRMRPAHADIFADEMRLGDGNVKFGRLFAGICGRVFDDETFDSDGSGCRVSDLPEFGCRQRADFLIREIFRCRVADARQNLHRPNR